MVNLCAKHGVSILINASVTIFCGRDKGTVDNQVSRVCLFSPTIDPGVRTRKFGNPGRLEISRRGALLNKYWNRIKLSPTGAKNCTALTNRTSLFSERLIFCSTLSEFENFLLCERILINVTTCQNETSS
jgi:hypothetical protein